MRVDKPRITADTRYWAQIISEVDASFHENDTPAMWNERIRTQIRNCFHKINLNNMEVSLFQLWHNRILQLPNDCSRIDLYSVAPLRCLYIVGI